MDFLSKAYEQIVDLFRSMTPGARIIAALLVCVIVASLGFLFRFQVESADDYLLGGRPFTAGELTAVQRALSEAKLGNWELEGNRIKIPSGLKASYIAALAENNALPADFHGYMDKAVDSENPFTSRFAMDVRLSAAKQKELALVISRFRNVEQASVIFDEVEKDGLRRQKFKTASVAVQTSGADLEEGQIRAIRNLLASSYAGLDRANISITDTTSGKSYMPPGDSADGGDNVYASAKAKFEADYKTKIQDRLAMVPGVIVGVNVDLSPETINDTTTIKYDAKPIPASVKETTIESSSSGPDTAGRPGAVPNGVNAVGNQPAEIASTPGPKTQNSETKSEQKNIAGHEHIVSRKAPLVPTRVTASIDVPQSYFVKIWRQNNPTPAGQQPAQPDAAALTKIETQEKERIENAIVKLLPAPPLGKEPYPLVAVTTYTDMPLAAPSGPSTSELAGGWFASNWKTVGMFLMSFIGLVMMRGMIRAAAPPAPAKSEAAGGGTEASAPHGAHAAATPGKHDATATEEEEGPPQILKMKRRLSTSGPNLREELRQLVKDDPDSAASVLRGWIGEAA